MRRRLAIWLLLVLFTLPALARVGGGQSYSSSSGYSSGSSSSGAGYSTSSGSASSSSSSSAEEELIGFLITLVIEVVIRLLIAYPKIGFPLLFTVGLGLWLYKRRQRQTRASFQQVQHWSQKRVPQASYEPDLSPALQQPELDRLKASDPNFSRPLFLDFVNLLYVRAQTMRGADLDAIGAFLSQPVRLSLDKDSGWQRVIIGGLQIKEVSLTTERQRVVVGVEANLESGTRASYVIDRMSLERNPGSLTPEPELVYSFACPNCGSKAPVRSGTCSTCQSKVNDGRFTWLLTELSRERSQPRVEVSLSESGQEVGTDRPTVWDPKLQSHLAALSERDPKFTVENLQNLTQSTFLALQAAWSQGSWQQARPLESDYLFGQHQLWTEAYARQGLRNCLDDVQVLRCELVKVELDRYFESATLRIFASMKDSTVRISDGTVLSGNAETPRIFSEYWTFIRRSGVTSKSRDLASCPNCGAALDKITVAGVCQYCDATITRGDFDWVLSRIEQDEAYSSIH